MPRGDKRPQLRARANANGRRLVCSPRGRTSTRKVSPRRAAAGQQQSPHWRLAAPGVAAAGCSGDKNTTLPPPLPMSHPRKQIFCCLSEFCCLLLVAPCPPGTPAL